MAFLKLKFRLDGFEQEQRKAEKEVEVLFDGNLYRNDSELFTGHFFENGNYGPPAGFFYGPFIPLGEAVVNNPESDAYNVPDVSLIGQNKRNTQVSIAPIRIFLH